MFDNLSVESVVFLEKQVIIIENVHLFVNNMSKLVLF